jgi:hypothetical protein
MKRWIGLILLLVPFLASAAGFWDGNAALQRGDSTFESGMFAASNSFPEDTKIVIVNAATGKSATATVTRRIDGQSDILVLLSPPAAAALGISQGTLASVRVTIAEPTAVASASPSSDQNLSQDPDLNPGAAYPQTTTTADTTAQPADTATTTDAAQAATDTSTSADQTAQPQEESLPAQATPTQTAAAPTVPANTPEAPQPEQPQTAQAAVTATTAPTTTAAPAADETAIAAAAAARTPQKQLFQPPREDPKFAYKKPAETPEQPATTQVTQLPPADATPQVTAVIGEPGVAPAAEPAADVTLAEAAAPDESVAQEIVGEGTPAPAPAPEPAAVALATPEVAPEEQPALVAQTVVPSEPVQTEVTGPAAVPPAAPEPPKLALVAPVAPAPQKAVEPQVLVAAKPADTQTPATTNPTHPTTTSAQPKAAASFPSSVKPGTYYLQLGAYATEKVARDLAATLASTYPALVLNSAGPGTPTFRVVVGPLNKAESGTLLTWFKRKGFPDAFLRQE